MNSIEPAARDELLLEMSGIRKSFSGVEVLKGVAFDVRAGEVHALVGENGAGKSTLMNILAGVHKPDAGSITVAGQTHAFIPNERAAQALGIAIVFQERSLFSTLSVAENVFAARQPVTPWGTVDRKQLFAETEAVLKEVGLDHIAPETPLTELSPAQQQMIEIAKALSLRARLIIFDEPTAALTDSETRALFRVIAQLKLAGAGIVYISHRLEEIFQIADRVTVLKDGEGQGTFRTADTTADQLISRMVGRELALHQRQSHSKAAEAPVTIEVRGLTDADEFRSARPFLRDISFHVHAGEIVVLAGLAGAGRTELALSLFGARRRSAGEILVNGERIRIHSPTDAIAAGIGYASEDRKECGLFLDMTVSENVVAARLRDFGSWWLRDGDAAVVTGQFRSTLRIASRDVHQVVHTLSGGNQQKVALAKWLLAKPKILIADEPTRGIDVGAKAEVHKLLTEVAAQGTAVIVISSDLPEVLAIADRIIVMREGRIAGELAGAAATEESVMRLASMSCSAPAAV